MNKDNNLNMLLAGVGIGAAAGFLLARYYGDDLKNGIRQGTDLLKNQAGAIADRVSTAAEAGQTIAKDAARNLGKTAKDFTGTAADMASKAASEVRDKSAMLASTAGETIKQQA